MKRAEGVKPALLGDLLVVVQEVGDVLRRQGDAAVVESGRRPAVAVLAGECSRRRRREQRGENHAGAHAGCWNLRPKKEKQQQQQQQSHRW